MAQVIYINHVDTPAFREAERCLEAAHKVYKPIKSYVLFSGGNDSTILLHHMWHLSQAHEEEFGTALVDAAVHINTGIGIEDTRTFVRTFCAENAIPLIEKYPPDWTYEELVLKHGFPGPAAHHYMYVWLKSHAIRALIREAKVRYRDQVLLINGQRKAESARRMRNVKGWVHKEGAQIWVSPYKNITKRELVEYRRFHDVAENEVAALLHMSGECLCGAFAKEGELDDIALWYPETAEYIRDLERRVAERGHERCKWGYGARLEAPKRPAGPLCTDCELRIAA